MPTSGEDPGPADAADPAREFLEFWRGYFEQTAIQSRLLLEGMVGGKSAEQLQGQWLEALGRSMEGFMRTPAFMDALKQSLARMVELKRMQDQAARAAADATGMPTPPDAGSVADRVRAAEEAILARLADIDARLRAIERAVRPRG
ncbi:hypothetical protein [Aquisphaera insulae]|uniref:hypothetical protein n=1 Tax=Aquisphaera insulae TaxID=2712864 RepID=UPI0013EB998E|nr:hypothetical protein [Aquisphaera insulae]